MIIIISSSSSICIISMCISTTITIVIIITKVSKAPQGNERGEMGSKNHPCILGPLSFSARHGSKNPGFGLRPLSPYAIASLGVAYKGLEVRLKRSLNLEGLEILGPQGGPRNSDPAILNLRIPSVQTDCIPLTANRQFMTNGVVVVVVVIPYPSLTNQYYDTPGDCDVQSSDMVW